MKQSIVSARGASRTAAPPRAGLARPSATTHEAVYLKLRERILFGGFKPGSAVTLRGLADTLGVSPMPIREAIRRLIAERALEMRDNRRVVVPPMTQSRFEQIVFARLALEPDLAARALKNMTPSSLAAIAHIDETIDAAMVAGDVEGYMRGNYLFHRTIYERAGSDILIALVDSIWLQFGPFMRMAYGLIGTSTLEDHHQRAIEAMRKKDARALRAAISADIDQGMSFIGRSALRHAS